jgi:hypothetical protein
VIVAEFELISADRFSQLLTSGNLNVEETGGEG